jgi:predicted PurR-regulated permease PerM
VWQEINEQLKGEVWGRQILALVAKARGEGAEAPGVAQAFSTTLGALVNIAVVLFMGVYMAINPGWYRRGVLRLISPPRRARAREILDAIGHTLRWWLFGRAVGMTIVGIMTTLGLWLLGVPFAAGLGVLAGLLDFVPFAGPILAAAPGVLVALSDGTIQVIYVLLLYFSIQLLEGYVLTPLIELRSVHLPPALTIGAQVLLGVLVGPIGVAVATPLTAVIVVLIEKLYVEDKLEASA